jgi:signal transduction histidine kinase
MELEGNKHLNKRLVKSEYIPDGCKDIVQEIIDALPVYVTLVDKNHHIIFANKAVSKDLGADPEKIIGEYCPKTIHGLDGPFPGCPLEEAAKLNKAVQTEMFDPGKRQWFKSGAYPIGKPGPGNQTMFLHTIQNISEEKLAAEELHWNYDAEIVLNQLLNMSLEDIPFKELLQRALNLLISIPWLSLESKGCIFLVDDQEVLGMAVQTGLDNTLLQSCKQIPFGKCLCGTAAKKKKAIFINHIDENHEIHYDGIVPHGHYCVPIMLKGKILGVINTYVKNGHEYSEREERFLINVSNILAGIIWRQQGEEQLRLYVSKVIQAQEQERRRISRELHDETLQSLTTVALDLEAMLIINRLLPAKIAQRLKFFKDNILGAVENISRVSHDLHPVILENLGLEAALETLTTEINTLGQTEVLLKITGTKRYLKDETNLAIYRITQEALNNIREHSEAAKATVNLKYSKSNVKLSIVDNGIGFNLTDKHDPNYEGELGLIGMRERAQLLGTSLKIKSAIGKGTEISMQVAQ